METLSLLIALEREASNRTLSISFLIFAFRFLALFNASEALLKVGASSVSAYVSHGVLSGPALQRIKESSLKELVTTNTIIEIKNENKNKIRRLSVAPLIAEAVKRIDNHSSVSSLFN